MHGSLNRVFKVIFSKSLGTFIAVPENARSGGKAPKSSVALAALMLGSTAAYAGPTGGNVVAGTANISALGNTTTITQATNRAIINWQSFNVGSAETVQFHQPSASAVTLNRVLSASPSAIDGILKANGRVFLVNPAGVVIGKGASVNVGGLVASTLNISDEDFLRGHEQFSGDGAGKIVNAGSIAASDGGMVALLGAQVLNSGHIVAREGAVFLAAAGSVTLTFGEGPTAHSIAVDKPTVDALVDAGGAVRVDGGLIVLAARAADGLLKQAINQTGVLEATSLTRKGGRIVLDGGAAGMVTLAGAVKADGTSGGEVRATGRDVLLSGEITARGEGDGGRVFIGGGARGQDPTMAHATNVAMTRTAAIDVSARRSGDGGTAVLWSDGSTDFAGSIKASGGALAGNGGMIETSGPVLRYTGAVDVSAPHGTAGEILLDPDIIIISNDASGAQDAQLPTIVNSTNGSNGTNTLGSTSYISLAALESIAAGNISLEAKGYILVRDLTLNGGDGAINLQPNVGLSLLTTNDLTPGSGFTRLPGRPSYGGIAFDNAANAIRARGTGSVNLQGGNSAAKGATAVSANGELFNIGSVSSESGSITLRGADGIVLNGNLTTQSGTIYVDADSDQGGVGKLIIGSSLYTDSGAVTLKGGNGATSGVDITGNIYVGTGSFNFDATAGTFSGTYRIAGKVEAKDNFTISQNVTLGGVGSIKTTGTLALTGNVLVQAGSDLTLTATNYTITNPINGNGATITLKPAAVTDDFRLGPVGGGTDVSPVMNNLTNFSNVTLGGNDLQGKITLSGASAITGPLSVLAGGAGGSIDILDGTDLSSSGKLTLNAAGDITASGNNTLTSTANKIQVIAGGNLTLASDSRLKGATVAEISVGGDFINPAGLALIDPSTPYWRLYLNDAAKLNGTGFNLSDGFHRYGCVILSGCATGTLVPASGNGILFAQAPTIDVWAGTGTRVYGTANPLTGIGYTIDAAGLINGDTLADLGVSGSAPAVFSGAPTLSSGGHVTAGLHLLSATVGSLTSTMGYRFAAPASSGVLTVSKKALTASASAANRAYDGTTAASASAALAGGMAGDALTGSVTSAVFSSKNVGTGKTVTAVVALAGADAGNYQLSGSTVFTTANITPKLLTNGGVTAGSKVYDGNADALAITTVNPLNAAEIIAGDVVSAALASAAFVDKNAGTSKVVNATVTIGGANASNYALANGATATTGSITPKTVTVSGVSTADKTYDGNTAAVTSVAGVSGLVAGDVVSASATASSFGDKQAGAGKTVTSTLALAGTDAGNYTLASALASSSASITQRAVTVASVTTAGKTYDGLTAAVSSAGSLLNALAGDTVWAAVTASDFADRNAGSVKTVTSTLALSGADAGNYALTSTAAASSASIDKRTVAATVNTADKVYDGTSAALSTAGALGNMIAGDNVAATVSASSFADKNAGAGKAVVSTVALAGADAGNYALGSTVVAVNASIARRGVTAIGLLTADKVYDGAQAATTTVGGLDNVISGDAIGASVTASSFGDRHAGAGKAVASTIALTGADAGNYSLGNTLASSTASIAQRSVSATGVLTSSKTYDGTRVATTTVAGLSDTVAGDNVAAAVTASSFADKHVGDNKAVTSTLALTGADAGNYLLASTAAASSAAIGKRTVAATVATADKTYDGGSAAVSTAGALSDMIAGDAVSATVSASNFADKHAGAGKAVVSTIALTGADAGNYALGSTMVAGSASIGRRSVMAVGVLTADKVYDGTQAATTTVSGLDDAVTGDAVSVNVTASSFSDRQAGAGKAVASNLALAGADAGNYTLGNAVAGSSASIAQRSVSAAGVATSNKTYDGTRAATTTVAGLSNTIAGDSVAVTVASSSFADKHAGRARNASTIIALRGADAGNYVLASSALNTTADVAQRTLTVSGATAADKVFDGQTVATVSGASLGNTVAGDNIGVAASGVFADKNAGVDKAVAITFKLLGADAGNYALGSATAQDSATIARKVLSFSTSSNGPLIALDNGRPAQTAQFTASLSGAVAGDQVSPAGIGFLANGSVTNGSLPGTYSVVVAGLSGADAGNYAVDTTATGALAAAVPFVVRDAAPAEGNLVEVRQQANFVPVYANGRAIDSRGRTTSVASDYADDVDAFKGARAAAAGVRGHSLVDSDGRFNFSGDSLNVPAPTLDEKERGQ